MQAPVQTTDFSNQNSQGGSLESITAELWGDLDDGKHLGPDENNL